MLKRFVRWYKNPDISHWSDFYVEWIEIRILLPLIFCAWIVCLLVIGIKFGSSGVLAVNGIGMMLCFIVAIVPNLVFSCLNLSGWRSKGKRKESP